MRAHAGRFRHRVQVQERTYAQGPMGGVETWPDLETRWAIVMPMTPATRVQYQARDSQATHLILFRGEFAYDLGKHRFEWDGRVFVPSDPEYLPGDRQEFTAVPVMEKPEEREVAS